MAQVHEVVNLAYAKENEVHLRQMSAAPKMSVAVRSSALFLVALALCAQQGVATSMSDAHSLRGQHHRHHIAGHHHSRFATAAVPEASAPKVAAAQAGQEDFLYNDFLALVNKAAEKTLKEKGDDAPAYDDFLHHMQKAADKAYKEQTGTPDYDEFLGFLKGKADEAYQEQVELPSYDDFLVALKKSTSQALKTTEEGKDPSFEDFLSAVAEGSEKAMQKRVFHDLKEDTFKKLEAKFDKVTQQVGNPLNPFAKAKEEDHDDSLRKELRHLSAEHKRQEEEHEKEGKPMPQHMKKPVMARINVLRTQLCWKRPNLWQHEKCLRFLGLHCMEQSTGEGICKAFAKKSKEKCESAEAAPLKEDYCALGEALGETHGEDEEVEKEEDEDVEEDDEDGKDGEEEAEAVKGKEETDKVVGSDEDLEEDLDAVDKELDDAEEDAADKDGAADKAGAADKDGVKDTDGDGIDDEHDQDIDGDGVNNDMDAFPADKSEQKDTDHDGVGDNADTDKDGDGTENDKDKFPDDPTEWKDSDGDGVGDNKDAHPYNPNCHSATEPCDDISEQGKPKPGSAEDPVSLDMSAGRKLPDQGFSEHLSGAPVSHNNYYTWVGDWQEEWPEIEDSEKQTMERICKEHPNNIWCHRFKDSDAHFR